MKVLIILGIFNLMQSALITADPTNKTMADLNSDDQAFVKHIIAIDTSNSSIPSTDIFKGKTEDQVVAILDGFGTFGFRNNVTTAEIMKNETFAKELLKNLTLLITMNSSTVSTPKQEVSSINSTQENSTAISTDISSVTTTVSSEITTLSSTSNASTLDSSSTTSSVSVEEESTSQDADISEELTTSKSKKKTTKKKKGKKKAKTSKTTKRAKTKKSKKKKATTASLDSV